jgi:hypothetical protein
MTFLWLVVIDDCDIGRTRRGPSETDAKLVVNPNAVLSRPLAPWCLQSVAWRHTQVSELTGNLELPKLAARDGCDAGKPTCAAPVGQCFGIGIPERDDHPQ